MKTWQAFFITAVFALGFVLTPLAAMGPSRNSSHTSPSSLIQRVPPSVTMPIVPQGPVDCSGGC